jgi:hypothetical protein
VVRVEEGPPQGELHEAPGPGGRDGGEKEGRGGAGRRRQEGEGDEPPPPAAVRAGRNPGSSIAVVLDDDGHPAHGRIVGVLSPAVAPRRMVAATSCGRATRQEGPGRR